MWTTVEQVKELTGSDVTIESIKQAQAIIESYVGRLEPEVPNASDKMLLGRATAYQAAYMVDAEDRTFQSIGAKSITQFGNMISFWENDRTQPFIAPLAVIACQRLSWKRLRSIKVGGMFGGQVPELDYWRYF